jgi:bifunctional non-homologous end joining protein LigD
VLKYSGHIAEKGKKFFHKAERSGLEGIMAKRAKGFYYSGKRTREWLKIKTALRQEVVIVGYTPPEGTRRYFGSLVLALRDKGRWVYAGRAGTGFDSAALKMIYDKMQPLVRREKPFEQKVPEEKATTWLKPKLVGEVKFTEWTHEGQMRHPAFIGLRDDKRAEDVTRERPVAAKA